MRKNMLPNFFHTQHLTITLEFIGIEYTKALDEKEVLNKNIAQLQFEVLGKEKKWISDTEADKLLNSEY